MLIVYLQALGLGAAAIAGLFGIYAATLIPGLLAGGPLSDRFGRRALGAVRGCPAVTGEPQAAHTWDHARS
jgi:MFS family permease